MAVTAIVDVPGHQHLTATERRALEAILNQEDVANDVRYKVGRKWYTLVGRDGCTAVRIEEIERDGFGLRHVRRRTVYFTARSN